MRFGTWIVWSLLRASSLTAAARELAKYKFDLVGVEEVRWNRGGMVREGVYNFSVEKETKPSIGNRTFLPSQNSINRQESSLLAIAYHIPPIVLRGRWCNITVLNVHAPSEEKSNNSKANFYKELEQVFDHFPMYHMKILLGDFNAKVGRENIFKPTIRIVTILVLE
jgi:hypothetical protein